MPSGDRTGPLGQGPRTGRARGFCSGYDAPGYEDGLYRNRDWATKVKLSHLQQGTSLHTGRDQEPPHILGDPTVSLRCLL
ncbi:DUF5320 domain-containing protein [Dysgonomonadaceae bacterium zrk40]|nr:DUF5320 domain-containing protein [Dysgonomonadaceae bacterium zrk40]